MRKYVGGLLCGVLLTAGKELATAPVEGRVGGKVAAADYWNHEENIQDKILMAKGDIAGWKSVKLTVHSLHKVE
jgi:hypothetical protein